jgi:hypothetical protein
MGTIVAGIVAAVVIAVGAGFVLREQGQERLAWEVYSTDSTRVADPGENLVGPAWTGEGETGAATEPGQPAS